MNEHSANIGTTEQPGDLSIVVIALLQGVVYRDERGEIWNALIALQPQVRDYLAVIGLELVLDEAEGYGFLQSRQHESEDGTVVLPRLVRRQQLAYPVSLLLALLRKKLAEFDAAGGDTRLILSLDEIVELFRVFLPAGSNEARLIDQIDAHINKVVKIGFVRPLKGQQQLFEVRRILKAFVDGQWLAEFDQRLGEYQQELRQKGEKANG
ncbi:DUF4194 domain-containing protein [Desulfopila aestuarii]|uniref:DUF4194 domain-containing protein n=1 Tax=Desulfopila aestuarii DSM 18488 TaxID=1121416 RepID=A0A1M7YJ77_9BACT|nr:DUF4194 domain-containing protein [Desulfopila aestuarii]SHO52662.1 protein of unknown function [Desulfopila aestuarii DSM 18488]